jgi:hypothetical protein
MEGDTLEGRFIELLVPVSIKAFQLDGAFVETLEGLPLNALQLQHSIFFLELGRLGVLGELHRYNSELGLGTVDVF